MKWNAVSQHAQNKTCFCALMFTFLLFPSWLTNFGYPSNGTTFISEYFFDLKAWLMLHELEITQLHGFTRKILWAVTNVKAGGCVCFYTSGLCMKLHSWRISIQFFSSRLRWNSLKESLCDVMQLLHVIAPLLWHLNAMLWHLKCNNICCQTSQENF